MLDHRLLKIIWIFLGFALGSCVSVSMPTRKAERDQNVKFVAPAKPFVELQSDDTDAAWRSEKSGNTIAVLSECGNHDDPPLENLKVSVTAALEDRKFIESNYLTFNKRKALKVVASGAIDGVESMTQILMFKKNKCIYILTYGASKENYALDVATFEGFLKSFGVP